MHLPLYPSPSKQKKTTALTFWISPSKKLSVFHSKSIENPQLQTTSSHTIQTTPPEQKLSAINYLTNRLLTYSLNVNRNKEHETIRHILHTNKYDPQLMAKNISTTNIKLQTTHTTQNSPTKKQSEKWSTFTYIGPQTKFITKLFKNTKVCTAYKTNNTVEKLWTHRNENRSTNSSAK